MWKEDKPDNTAAALENQRKGIRARQTMATFKVSLGMIMCGYASGWNAPTIELFLSGESPVPLTESQVSWMLAATPLGSFLGTLPSALLMNHLGRRGTLLLLNVICVLSWALTYSASSFPLLMVSRVLSGSWIGVCFTIVPNYIGEIVDPDLRSSMISVQCFMQRFGYLAVFTVGTYSSYWDLSLVGVAFGLSYWFVLLTVPESPYYYVMVSEKEKAFESLAHLQNNININEKLSKLSAFVYADIESKASLLDLLRDPIHFKNAIKVALASILMGASGGHLLVVLPILIPANSIPHLSNNECSIIGALISVVFSYRPKCLTLSSSRFSIFISGTVCGICMAIIATWYYFENKVSFVKLNLYWVPLVCYLIHLVFFSLFMYPTVTGLRGEMFPTKFKGILASFVSACFTMTIAVVLQLYINIRTHFGNHINFIIGSVSCFSLVLLTYFCLIETEGKSLEDIQNYLNSKSRADLETGQKKFVD